MNIRKATTDDALAIATVHVESWQTIYRGHFPDEFLDGLDVASRASGWVRILTEEECGVTVAELNGSVCGFVYVSQSRDDDADETIGEVAAIYLQPSIWRRGVGAELMAWAKREAATRGWREITLWVLRENTRARGFYEASGFRLDGARKEQEIGGAVAYELRYRYGLSAQ